MSDEHSFLANSSLPSIEDMETGNRTRFHQDLDGSGYLEEDVEFQRYQQRQSSHGSSRRGNNSRPLTLLEQEYADDDDDDEDEDYQEYSGTTMHDDEYNYRGNSDDNSDDGSDDDDDDDGDDDDDDDDDEDDEDYVLEEGDDDSRLPDETGIEYSDDLQSQSKSNNNMSDHEIFSVGLKTLESKGLVDIGNIASWSVSSSKANCGVKELRDDSPDTYWQSDGNLPHFIQIRFAKKVSVERLSFYLDYALDESYTPGKIQILAGSGEHDLIPVTTKEFIEPTGWNHILFKGIRRDDLLKPYLIKIKFLSNHQNGKDSHVRALKVMTPLSKTSVRQDIDDLGVGFTSIKLMSESAIR